MHQVGQHGDKRYKYIAAPVFLFIFVPSLICMILWTLVLPKLSAENDHHDLELLAGLVLWCIWGFIINLGCTLAYVCTRLIESEPQSHLVILISWSEVGSMYCTLFSTSNNQEHPVLYSFQKTFLGITGFSLLVLIASRVSYKYLVTTSGSF